MISHWVAVAILAASLLSAAIGFRLQRVKFLRLGEESSRASFGATVGFSTVLVATTMGLATGASKSIFDDGAAVVSAVAHDAVQLDEALQQFGVQGAELRRELGAYVQSWADFLEAPDPATSPRTNRDQIISGAGALQTQVSRLATTDAELAYAKDRAQSAATNLCSQERTLMIRSWEISPLMIVLPAIWVMLQFLWLGLGLDSKREVHIGILVSAIIVSSVFYTMVELNNPFQGYFRVSEEPLQRALRIIGL